MIDNSELVNQAIYDVITSQQKLVDLREYIQDRLDIACSLAGVDEDKLKMGKAQYNELCKMLEAADVEGRGPFMAAMKPTKAMKLSARDESFVKYWNAEALSYGRPKDKTLDAADDLSETLSKFISRGVRLDELHHFVSVALKNKKVGDEDCWRYFCGCAWRRIREAEGQHPNAFVSPAVPIGQGVPSIQYRKHGIFQVEACKPGDPKCKTYFLPDPCPVHLPQAKP